MFDLKEFSNKTNIIPAKQYSFKVENYNVSLRTGIFIRFNHLTRNHLHMHHFYEICLVIDGRGEFLHDDKKYPLKPGCVFIANPNTMHEISSLQTKDLYLFFYSFSISKVNGYNTEKSIIDDFLKNHRILYISDNRIMEYLDLYTRYSQNNPIYLEMNKNIIFNLFLDNIMSLTDYKYEMREKEDCKHHKLNEIITYIQDHLAENIYVSKMAKELYMSDRNLRRIVKKYYQQTVNELIINIKINASMGYLQNGYPISDIAEKLGFSSHAYFSKVFKDNIGISPSKFKLTY